MSKGIRRDLYKFYIGSGITCLLIGLTVFFLHTGYKVPNYVDTGDNVHSNYENCQEGPPARLAEVAPIQAQIDAINGQLNAIGQQLSTNVPVGTAPVSILDLANRYDKSDVPIINSLDAQYDALDSQLTVINRKYGC